MFNMICIIWYIYIYISNDDIHIELSMFLVASGQQRSSYPGHEGGRGAAFAALKNMENPRKWRFHRKNIGKYGKYTKHMGQLWENHGKTMGKYAELQPSTNRDLHGISWQCVLAPKCSYLPISPHVFPWYSFPCTLLKMRWLEHVGTLTSWPKTLRNHGFSRMFFNVCPNFPLVN